MPEMEEAIVVAGDGRLGQVQLDHRLCIGTLGVVPNHETPILDLLGDQLDQVVSDNALAHGITRAICTHRVCRSIRLMPVLFRSISGQRGGCSVRNHRNPFLAIASDTLTFCSEMLYGISCAHDS